jgi:hypothetical protein
MLSSRGSGDVGQMGLEIIHPCNVVVQLTITRGFVCHDAMRVTSWVVWSAMSVKRARVSVVSFCMSPFLREKLSRNRIIY